MAKFNWDDYEEVKTPNTSFNWDEHPIEPPVNPKTSPVTAAATGIIQGAVPFAAPLAGVGRATMNTLTGVSPPSDIIEQYRAGRNQFQKEAKEAAEASPKTAFAGNLAGGFANPLFKGADSLPAIAGAAGVQGLGLSEADLTKGEVGKAAKETGLSMAGGALGYGVGKALPKVADVIKWGGKKFLTTLGPSEEAINARLAGRAQDTAKDYGSLAEDFAGTIKKLKAQIADHSQDANAHLSSEANIPKPYLADALDQEISKLKIPGNEGDMYFGETDKSAANTLSKLREDISKLPDNLSQKDLKKIVQKMDDNINWDDQSQNKLNGILEQLRHNFDSTLKFQNSKYAKAMEPVSDRMGLLNDLKRQFNLRNVPGEGHVPTDTTATKLQTSLRDNKKVTQENLGKLKDFTGDDYLEQAKDFQLANQFEHTGPHGAKRTALGAAIGGLIGHGSPTAIGIGGAIGSTLDRYGGSAVGSLIDTYVKAGNSQAFGKFAPALEAAAKRGPDALAVAGSVLGNNPEFRAIVDKLTSK